MNLQRADPETDMEMNMTPMIDVVFLLIIFFMIITDMTQQDLEDLELPMVRHAKEDKPKPDEWRPILNITYDGRMVHKRKPLYAPETHDHLANPLIDVQNWLVTVAKKMEKDDGMGFPLPDEHLMIRADMSTPFKHVQKVMELCAVKGIQIWKIQLACSVPDANALKDN